MGRMGEAKRTHQNLSMEGMEMMGSLRLTHPI